MHQFFFTPSHYLKNGKDILQIAFLLTCLAYQDAELHLFYITQDLLPHCFSSGLQIKFMHGCMGSFHLNHELS